MNKSLIDYQREKPLEFLILIILYCVGASSIPNIKIADFFHLGQSFDMLFFCDIKSINRYFSRVFIVGVKRTKRFKI